MKKVVLIVAALILSITMLSAQSFEKGNHGINLGIGLGNIGHTGSYYAFRPSISGSYEIGIVEVPMGSELTGVVGVGGYLGWAPFKYGLDAWTDDSWYWSGNHIILAARGTYHFIFNDKFDPYAGIYLGLDIETWKWHGDSAYPDEYSFDNNIGVAPGFFVGARYFFSPNWAAYAELGYTISFFNIGMSYKIK